MPDSIPVIVFVYARTAHLEKVLDCLKANAVPLIYFFSDGAKGPLDAAAVTQVRVLIRAIDWCDVRLTERTENVGLGRNILAGVSEVAAKHDAFIVWEDDLICVPGTYDWMCAALRNYAADNRVMSVTGWTHPRVTPPDVGTQPWFDARAECWVWGAWARSWPGMIEQSAMEKRAAVERAGMKPDAYGRDLPVMAAAESQQNTWAVRWLYHHFQHRGLCIRPPWSLVEHIGFDPSATNASVAAGWTNPPLRAAPPPPVEWPDVREHPQAQARWRAAYAGGWRELWSRLRSKLRRA